MTLPARHGDFVLYHVSNVDFVIVRIQETLEPDMFEQTVEDNPFMLKIISADLALSSLLTNSPQGGSLKLLRRMHARSERIPLALLEAQLRRTINYQRCE